uniref:Tc1-like transposase DDE domain-containing protein n=1 Tax=Amphiprion percula TaxID=161767 RepID=A0A3P8RLB9_AMPPE
MVGSVSLALFISLVVLGRRALLRLATGGKGKAAALTVPVQTQDNDPKHTSRLCQGYLTKKESDGVLCQKTWSPQSADLNPFEMVWDELDHRVKAKGPTGAQHLWELLQKCWKPIPGHYLMRLTERMPRVCKAVIKAKGG